jgi:hypothetical protein
LGVGFGLGFGLADLLGETEGEGDMLGGAVGDPTADGDGLSDGDMTNSAFAAGSAPPPFDSNRMPPPNALRTTNVIPAITA